MVQNRGQLAAGACGWVSTGQDSRIGSV